MNRLLTISIAIGVILTACGGSSSTTTSEEGDATVAQPSPTAIDVAEPTATPSPPSGAAEEDAEPATPISTVLANEPVPGGWPVPAGKWSTDAFDVPVEFTTSTDMLLVRESRGALWLRTPGSDSDTDLVLATAAFVNTGGIDDPQLPPPTDVEGINARFEQGRFTALLDAGVVETSTREIPWWDFELGAQLEQGAWHCGDATACLMTGQTVGGERIILPTNQRTRLYLASSEPGIGAWLAAPPATMQEVEALAEDLLDDLKAVDRVAEQPSTRSLTVGGVERTDVPTGRTLALVGGGLVTLTPQGDLPGIGLDVVNDSAIIFGTPSGYLALLSTDTLVPAGVDVADRASSVDWPLVDAPDAASFQEWVDGRLGVLATGTESLLGAADVPWWDITVLDAANSYPCAPTIGGRCDLLHISDIGAWAFADGDRNRIYHFADSGVMVHIEALNGTVLDVLLEGAPLLDALTITPVG